MTYIATITFLATTALFGGLFLISGTPLLGAGAVILIGFTGVVALLEARGGLS